MTDDISHGSPPRGTGKRIASVVGWSLAGTLGTMVLSIAILVLLGINKNRIERNEGGYI